jgi:hypothetical protein
MQRRGAGPILVKAFASANGRTEGIVGHFGHNRSLLSKRTHPVGILLPGCPRNSTLTPPLRTPLRGRLFLSLIRVPPRSRRVRHSMSGTPKNSCGKVGLIS